jgi:hypothetical protein
LRPTACRCAVDRAAHPGIRRGGHARGVRHRGCPARSGPTRSSPARSGKCSRRWSRAPATRCSPSRTRPSTWCSLTSQGPSRPAWGNLVWRRHERQHGRRAAHGDAQSADRRSRWPGEQHSPDRAVPRRAADQPRLRQLRTGLAEKLQFFRAQRPPRDARTSATCFIDGGTAACAGSVPGARVRRCQLRLPTMIVWLLSGLRRPGTAGLERAKKGLLCSKWRCPPRPKRSVRSGEGSAAGTSRYRGL